MKPLGECGPGGRDFQKYESGFKEEKKVEDNDTQEAKTRKAQAEANLQRKIDEATERVQVKLALRELVRRNPEPFEDLSLHFDDPTDDLMADEVREMYDQLPVESGRNWRWK